MQSPRAKLISLLIRKRLYEEIEQIISISRQGFDVHVKSEFVEVEKLLITLLEQELKNTNANEFKLIIDPKFLNIELENVDNDTVIKPTVFVNSDSLQSGFGFVKYHVRPPDCLLGSASSAIASILDYFGLAVFIDVFDSCKLSRLKVIAKTIGLGALIDAVIQTAYLGGFHGDSQKAQQYLDGLEVMSDSFYSSKEEISNARCAEKFFNFVVLRGEDAHAFLKSSLSFYAVKVQGFSMTRASQVLQISRTTLQEHLKIAEQLGVSNFFEGYRQRTN